MKYLILFSWVLLLSCSAAKVAVPGEFEKAATPMKVKGVNGWMINQQLTFGEYQTSSVKRGWDFTSVWQASRISFKPEDQILKVFDINTDNRNTTEKNKLQFTITNGKEKAAVFALEKFNERQLVYKNRDPRWGELARTTSLQYAFSAAIMMVADAAPEPWQLVMVHKEGKSTEYEEQGYLTNGDIQFSIQTLRIGNYTNTKGKEVKVLGGPTFAGYEIRIDGGVVGIVDLLDNQIWILNDLDPAYKMMLAAASSSLLLKRKQDLTNN
ncbi:hypothetical protein [Flavihumibacter sp. UBA7668]|uniref:hypothetical protein n=1 Tax=Flavihumibacter sp. UBA7668 TaxID=1946542 RepID=UPI0025BE32D4|nr:hypothetical protein [Flavihumibacter sp. UBA7668]